MGIWKWYNEIETTSAEEGGTNKKDSTKKKGVEFERC